MGASYISRRIKETNKEDIKKKFREIVDECLYEYGHDSYNGTFSTMSGISIVNKTFSDRDSADDYICDHSEKWGDALAVTVKEDGKEPYTLIGGWAAE
jgi:hypothetical protein